MAATLAQGMRAISFGISTDSSAGGFILPNDRVDVILTRKPEGNSGRSIARTILSNVRVLAVDQVYRQEKDTRTVIGKTATVELAPEQAEAIAAASQSGLISLALRPLSDGVADNDDNAAPKKRTAAAYDGAVSVIRYGIIGTANRQEPQ
jgi:pilus assembly protein CpaB